ncbi:hypothetical protein LSH36_606g03008 [Paralvinella palmiformis]|uniref:POU domain protein n=1 Tax=Paralvinella palmiformis TaxID=53620 RepID=A0AAD9J5D5_9ANNE|nr:hypothetical protein LSH36_606g03008 [Paralvinella palmiformis]
MLSGTSTQSPVSSVLTMPTVNMPSVSMPTGSISAATMTTAGALADSLFLGAVNGNDLTGGNGLDSKELLASLSHHALSTQPQQLLGQPQVAPQLILTNPGLNQNQSGTIPVQQLLIPVSAANGTQQLLSLPISLAAGAGGQIQLLTASSGQLLATNLANLVQPSMVAMTNTGTQLVQPIVVVSPSLQNISQNHTTQSAATQVVQQAATAGTNSAAAAGATSIQAAAAAASQLPQLIANAQGQIFAIGAPPQVKLLQAQVQSQAASNALANAQLMGTASHNAGNQVISTSTIVNPQTLTPTASTIQLSQITQSAVQSAINHSLGGATTTTVSVQQPVTTTSEDGSQAVAVTPNINQLLPNTISSAAEGTIVDGVNLDEIREFAKRFKIWRLSLGLTQTQVGQALSAREGPSYSQSAICRFEKLDITPKSAQKIKPVLERWMAEAEERYKNGMQNLSEFIGSEPSKKRKRRTSFTPQALEVLNEHFERNTHPSGAEMTELSEKLNYDREVIRVWFCNKRQALKNTIKKLKTDHNS